MAGYDENFLGVPVPLPEFNTDLQNFVLRSAELTDDIRSDHPNYTVVTNRARRAPILTALNIDQDLLKTTDRKSSWKLDPQIDSAFQLNNDYYRDMGEVKNPWDKGHLAMRENAASGTTQDLAQKAANETFYYSNASLQHGNFNRDEWVTLENWVHDLELDSTNKISVFSGPMYGMFPRVVTPPARPPATVPGGFFKIVCFIGQEDELDVRAFIMLQDPEALKDLRGRRMFEARTYQVTITEIELATGLKFSNTIRRANPLFHNPGIGPDAVGARNLPEHIEVTTPNEIIASGDTRVDVHDDDIDVFIAAAMVNPKGRDVGKEWISIINLWNKRVNLEGWTVSDTKRELVLSAETNSDDDLRLSPGEAVVINPLGPLRLVNTGGAITLFAPPDTAGGSPRRVDRVNYMKSDVGKPGATVIFGIRRGPEH